MSTLDRLRDPSVLIVFLYAPTGLGHLRVTKALYEGLQEGTPHILLGADDVVGNRGHRFMSSYPWTRKLMEFLQDGLAEELIAIFYRQMLRRASPKLYQHLHLILKQQITVPKTVLLVATHFGLAHQLAALKKQFAKQQNLRVLLIVQVTDDSPQVMWDIPGADLIMVPSAQTTKALATFHRNNHEATTHFSTVAYPIAPDLAAPLSKERYTARCHQLDPEREAAIHVAIPISGAAVGVPFYEGYIRALSSLSNRFVFHIVCKKTSFTEEFLSRIVGHSQIKAYTSTHDRDVISLYEELYMRTPIALEVTKPSEQTFKALADPKKVGGSILLFTEPVGRQEYDNLDFLERHHLIPTHEQMLNICGGALLDKAAKTWRGLVLPFQSDEAAHFTFACLKAGIFSQMLNYQPPKAGSSAYQEVNPYGVQTFWKTVSYLLDS